MARLPDSTLVLSVHQCRHADVPQAAHQCGRTRAGASQV